MALIDTLADNDPYINLHINTPLMLLQGNTSDMMSEEMGSVGPKMAQVSYRFVFMDNQGVL